MASQQTGDAPYFKSLADNFRDQRQFPPGGHGRHGRQFPGDRDRPCGLFHQSDDARRHAGDAARPIRSRTPIRSAARNNYYTQDGYGGGSYVNCHDLSQPGVAAIDQQLRRQERLTSANARRGTIISSTTTTCIGTRRSRDAPRSAPTNFTLPPQTASTIVDVLTRAWRVVEILQRRPRRRSDASSPIRSTA